MKEAKKQAYMLSIEDKRIWGKFRAKTVKNRTTMRKVLWQAVIDYVGEKSK